MNTPDTLAKLAAYWHIERFDENHFTVKADGMAEALVSVLSHDPVEMLLANLIQDLTTEEPILPIGWVPLRLEWEPGYPEDVAFGPQIMMDRLKKWLERHIAALTAQAPAAAEPDMESALAAAGITVWGPRAEDFKAGADWQAAQAPEGWVPMTLEQHAQALDDGDLMAIAEEVGGARLDSNVVQMTRGDFERFTQYFAARPQAEGSQE